MAASVLLLHETDHVWVARVDLPAGAALPAEGLACRDPIPRGHKVARVPRRAGEPVWKYGNPIGVASRDIAAGEHVHTHNLVMHRFEPEYAPGADAGAARDPVAAATFRGIVRADGRVATRNYLGVLASVSCAATVARQIADAFRGDALAEFPRVDGVVALPHSLGCGMAGGGEGFGNLTRTLAGFARHPNFTGVLLVGLGCEVNQVEALVEEAGLEVGPALRTLDVQRLGGTRAAVTRGVSLLREMLPGADRVERQPVPASHLVLGLECGGSDAYSGITANPALGNAADRLVRASGTAILGETTEIYGAEHLLVRRASSPEVGERLLERIRWWEAYTARHGEAIDNNPSPGNKAGGLTTILEKSLGAAAKGGTSPLVEVYRYAEPVRARGLVFMDTPGYDTVSVTGMVAGGANVVCFTTGRGTVVGAKPVPVLKLATNTPMYRRMADDMDLDCGPIADGLATVEEVGEAIFRRILETASGARTRSEELGFGELEFAPWQVGAVL